MNKFKVWDLVKVRSYNWLQSRYSRIYWITEDIRYETAGWYIFPEEALEEVTQVINSENIVTDVEYNSLTDMFDFIEYADEWYCPIEENHSQKIVTTIRNFRKRFHNKFKDAETFWKELEKEILDFNQLN